LGWVLRRGRGCRGAGRADATGARGPVRRTDRRGRAGGRLAGSRGRHVRCGRAGGGPAHRPRPQGLRSGLTGGRNRLARRRSSWAPRGAAGNRVPGARTGPSPTASVAPYGALTRLRRVPILPTMSGEEGSLGEIRKALAGITRRLDSLAAAVGVAARTGEPP